MWFIQLSFGAKLTSVRGTAGVINLAKENAALVVHSLDDRFPSFHLLLSPDPRGVWKHEGAFRNGSSFGDKETPRSSALCVVERCVRRLGDKAV